MKNILENKWTLPVILLAALFLRLIPAVSAIKAEDRLLRPDSGIYLNAAQELVTCGSYQTTRRPPGYPAFAAIIYALGGKNSAVALTQVAIAVATCWIVAMTGREVSGKACGNLAAGLMAVNLTAIANTPLLLSDTLFAFFIAGQFYFFVRYRRMKQLREVLLLALTAGFATLIRPINQLMIVVIPVLIAMMTEIPWKKRCLHIAAAVITFAAVITPWMMRNYLAGATFAVDTNTGAMRHQNGAMLLAKVNGTSYEFEKQKLRDAEAAELADRQKYPDERSREQWRIKEFKQLVMKYPFTYFSQHFDIWILLPDAPTLLECCGWTTSDKGTMNVLKKDGIFAAVRHYFGKNWLSCISLLIPLLIPVIILYAATAAKIMQYLRNIRSYWFEIFVLLGLAEYYLFLPGAITAPRYQLPALPCLCVTAALAIIEFLQNRNEHQIKNSAALEM